MRSPVVLIAGASGLVGTAAASEFAQHGWEVITASRRRPVLLAPPGRRHVTLDLGDADACARAAAGLGEVTHVVYAAVQEAPGLIGGWTDAARIALNGAMLRNLMDPLSRAANLEHVTILQGTKAYGSNVRRMRVPARESQPRVEHPSFYWLHEDYITAKSAAAGFTYTIFRPQLIVGPNWGVAMNLPPVIGAFAAICHATGTPFGFPGGAEWVWEAADVRLVARAIRWAATAPQARGQTFNLTNGEVFSFRDMWPALAEVLGMPPAADAAIRLAGFLPAHASVWDDIVRRHGLRPIPLEALLGESHHYADLCFAYGRSESPPPTFVSTVKIKQAGFTDALDTEQSFRHWLAHLTELGVLPPPPQ